MTSALKDKKSRIILVDPSGPVRQMMTETTRSTLGYENVEAKSSITDVIQFLEVEKAAWVIVPLMADQPANALHLLKICTENAVLKKVRVSVLVEEEEKYILPTAYELGLFSHHPKPFTKDTLSEEFKTIQSILEANGYNEPKTSAHYLRTYLKAGNLHPSQIALEKGLLDMYPGDPSVLLELAHPQFHSGQQDSAKKTLAQVKLLDPKYTEKVEAQAKALFGDQGKAIIDAAGSGGDGSINVLGANNVVIIDSDDASSRGVEDILKKLGATNIVRFANGVEAWQHLEKSSEPDLIISEWKIPKLSGPLLIQRIRHHGFHAVPIIILSSLLKPEDMPLVKEISVANIIQKPLNADLFIPNLILTMQQERMPTEFQALERKIRHLLKANKKDDAEPFRLQFIADPNIPMAKKRTIEAEFALANANYPLARDAAIDALKLGGENILVLNTLGKALMRLSDFANALKFFKKAQEMSPNNIERICLIAETETELGNEEGAKDALQTAKAIDPDAQAVTEANVKVAITKGDSLSAKNLMESFDSVENIVSYMNNKAVAFAKIGKPNEAIGLYKKTLESIPDHLPDPKAIVLYNLALAQIKDKEFDAAMSKLNEAMKYPTSRIAKKISSLRDRSKTANEKGQALSLKASDANVAIKANTPAAPGAAGAGESGLSSEEDQAKLIALVEAKRGDMCCYMIFTPIEAKDAKIPALLAKQPRFQSRSSIEREEAMNANLGKQSA